MLAIVDTGPLYAAVDADDDDHQRCVAALRTPGLRLIIPALVVAEATWLVGSRMGPAVEAAFLAGLAGYDVEGPTAADVARMAALVEQYGDLALGGTDASVVAAAERLGTTTIITLDRRHFSVVVPAHAPSLDLLPP